MSGQLFEPSEHGHGHGHERQKSTLGRAIKWVTTLGNGAIGVTEMAIAQLNTLSTLADGIHNIGDFASYWLQFDTVHRGHMLDVETIKKRRRISHSFIMGLSFLAMAQVGCELLDGEKETHYNSNVMYAGAASLVLSGGVLAHMQLRAMRQKRDRHGIAPDCNSAAEHDIRKHLLLSDIPSAAMAVGGAWLQRNGYDMEWGDVTVSAEQLVAVGSSALTAYFFRPTKGNLDDPCASGKL